MERQYISLAVLQEVFGKSYFIEEYKLLVEKIKLWEIQAKRKYKPGSIHHQEWIDLVTLGHRVYEWFETEEKIKRGESSSPPEMGFDFQAIPGHHKRNVFHKLCYEVFRVYSKNEKYASNGACTDNAKK